MLLKKKAISAKDGEGFVILSLQTDEDAWHAYNLIAVGDVLRAPTRRAVSVHMCGLTAAMSSCRKVGVLCGMCVCMYVHVVWFTGETRNIDRKCEQESHVDQRVGGGVGG